MTAASPAGRERQRGIERLCTHRESGRGCRTAEREQGTRQAPTGKLDPRQPINKLTIPPAGLAPIFHPASALLSFAP